LFKGALKNEKGVKVCTTPQGKSPNCKGKKEGPKRKEEFKEVMGKQKKRVGPKSRKERKVKESVSKKRV